MAGILRPILIGGGWGLGLGVAATAATVLSPALRPLARRALKGYLGAAARARERAIDATAHLEDLYEPPTPIRGRQ